MVQTVVYLSILWPHLRQPKLQLSRAESALTVDTGKDNDHSDMKTFLYIGNHVVIVKAITKMKSLKSNNQSI